MASPEQISRSRATTRLEEENNAETCNDTGLCRRRHRDEPLRGRSRASEEKLVSLHGRAARSSLQHGGSSQADRVLAAQESRQEVEHLRLLPAYEGCLLACR